MDLKDYWEALNKHDWYFPMTDDPTVYNRGYRNEDYLKYLSESSSEHKAMFLAFQTHYYSGQPFSAEQSPKPPKPL